MAVTRTGSVVRIDNSADSGSQFVTVPSDADAILVGVGGYVTSGTPGNRLDGAVLSIGGSALTYLAGAAMLDAANTPSGELVAMYARAALPGTGSQTFAWDWEGAAAWTEGGSIFVAFLKGVDQTSPTGSAIAGTVQGGVSPRTATTGTLTIASGDYVGVAAYAFSDTLGSFTWATNLTEQHDATYNGGRVGWADGTPAANQTASATYTFSGGGNGLVGCVAVVMKASTATDGEATSPVLEATGVVPVASLFASSSGMSPTAGATGAVPDPLVAGVSWEDIDAGTASTYEPAGDDVGTILRCVVTATNGAGSADAASNETAEVEPSGDANVTSPALDATGSVPASTVTASATVTSPSVGALGDLPAPTVSNGSWEDIDSATASTYLQQAGDEGALIRCVVTASNAAGGTEQPSNEVGPVEANVDATVTAPPLDATGDIPTPGLPVSVEVVSGQLSAVGAVVVPAVSGATNATVTAPASDATGAVPAPVVSGSSVVVAPVLDAAGDVPVPSVAGSSAGEVPAPPLDATGRVPVPALAAGQTVVVPPLRVTGDVPAPRVGDPTLLPELVPVGFQPSVPVFAVPVVAVDVGTFVTPLASAPVFAVPVPAVPVFAVASPDLVYA